MMTEDRLALQKAVDSGDTDLGMLPRFSMKNVLIYSCSVYHVLLQLYKRLRLGDFFRLIEDGGSSLAPASRLLQVYAREQNPEMLRDFYYSDDRRVESAVLNLEEARRMKASDQLFFCWSVILKCQCPASGPCCEDHIDQSRTEVLLRGQGPIIRGQGWFSLSWCRPGMLCIATVAILTHAFF
jgi:Vps16, C-terminal region